MHSAGSSSSNSVALLRLLPNLGQHAYAGAKLGRGNVGKQFMPKFERRRVDLCNHPLRSPAEMDGFATAIVRQAFACHPAFPFQPMQ